MAREDQWENLCKRCGRCCYEKIDFEGEIYYTETPCEFLDLTSNLCTVYAQRHEMRPGCVPLSQKVFRAGILPSDCPYVSGIKDYKGPKLSWDED